MHVYSVWHSLCKSFPVSTGSLCRFLANTAKDVDLRKWAVEGLAYLTLDAEIKEELVEDPDSLQALVEIAKVI